MSSTSMDSEVTSSELYETITESDEPKFDNHLHNGDETNDTEHNLDVTTDSHQSSEHHNDKEENHGDEHDHENEHENDHEHHHEHENDYNKADQSSNLLKNIHKRTRGKHSDSTNSKKGNKL
ncbi:unnamed protein product [Schistosoma spindalis]|nr:unnamed protein product [Schistosoma spindale]